MNLNYRRTEYDLLGTQTEEAIRIYGLKVKWIFTQKVNSDIIFGDFSHYKADDSTSYEVYVMPENAEDFDEFERLQTQFPGVIGDSSMNLYISKISMRELVQKSENTQNQIDVTQCNEIVQKLIGSLLILPSGQIMEVTNLSLDVLGANNAFMNAVDKNVYTVKCRTYVHKASHEVSVNPDIKDSESLDNGETPDMFDTLDKYFIEMTQRNESIKEEAKNRFDKEDPVFGRF